MNAGAWIAVVMTGYVIAIGMILRLRSEVAKARYEAEHDPLTGLLRGYAARDYLNKRRRHGHVTTGIMLDLDNFKDVNDRYGHRAGDQLLAAVGVRLSEQAQRLKGVAARLGGDEFLLLLPALPPSDHAAAVLAIHEELRTPVVTDSHEGLAILKTSATAGIATAGVGHDWSQLMHDADVALYHAKHNGGGFCFYRSDMPAPGTRHDRRHREQNATLARIVTAVTTDSRQQCAASLS